MGGHYNGYEKEQTTYATLGNGNVTVGGEALAGSDINRDLSNTQEITKDIEIGGLNASVTVDHRVFDTEDGWNSIKKDFVDSSQHIQEIGQAAEDVSTTDQSATDFFGNVKDYAIERETLVSSVMNEDAQNALKGENGAQGSEDALQSLSDQLTDAQGLETGADVALYDGSQIIDDTVVIDKTSVNKTEVKGAYHEDGSGIYFNIDKTDMTNSTDTVSTLVHEQTRHRLSEEGQTGNLSRDDQTTLATNHGKRAGEVWEAYSDLAGISTQGSTTKTNWNDANRHSSNVKQGTKQISSINNNDLKARQLNIHEASMLDQARANINGNEQLTDAQKAQALRELDAVACAEVECARGVSENAPKYQELLALQQEGEALNEQDQTIFTMLEAMGVDSKRKVDSHGRMPASTRQEFQYDAIGDSTDDTISRNEKGVARVNQAGQLIGGGAAVVGGAVACAGSAGLACVGGAALGTLGAVEVTQGAEALSQDYQYQNDQRVLDSFSVETHQGNYNPTLDAATDAVVNVGLGAAGKAALNTTGAVVDVVHAGKKVDVDLDADRSVGAMQTPQEILDKGDNPYDGIEYEVVESGDASGTMHGGDVVPNNTRTYAHNMVENPGPLASLPNNPAANFAGGKYNTITLEDDLILYRTGEAGGGRNALGQWFTREPAESVAQVRIDLAVKPQWKDANGVLTGSSPVESVYQIKIPKGTAVYEGPVGN